MTKALNEILTEAPVQVWHARRTADGGWGNYVISSAMIPVEASDSTAPGVARAQLELNIPGLRSWPWQWRRHVAQDDMIMIVQVAATGMPAVIFDGFVTDCRWRIDSAGRAVAMIYAVGRQQRLVADSEFAVYGRYMKQRASVGGWPVINHYSGLPCSFNAGGRPNCVEAQIGVNTYQVFGCDDAPSAEYWTALGAIRYLLQRYNAAAEPWLTSPTITDAQEAASPVIFTDVEGLGLWEALAAIADDGGYDVAAVTAMSEPPEGNWWEGPIRITSAITVTRRGSGDEIVINHQAPAADGTPTVFDVERTNLMATSVTERSAGCVTAPIVLGGRDLYETTITLKQAWDPDLLDDLAGLAIVPAGEEAADSASDYVAKYCTIGSEFAAYAAAGRLYDANTDGLLSASPYSLTTTDMAALCGQTAGSWPLMNYDILPMLTGRSDPAIATPDVLVEWSYDLGTTWYVLDGAEIVPGRLAIYLPHRNLAAIVPQESDREADGRIDSLIAHLRDDYVWVRITCCVAAPSRQSVSASRRAGAGTAFATSRVIDRGDLDAARIRSASSRYAASGVSADEASAGTNLVAQATRIQDLNESRLVEAQIPLEWIEVDDVPLGGVVKKIAGIEVSLAANVGPAVKYPRIVARRWMLRPEAAQTILSLDVERGRYA
jgi:hypothetical protein